MDKYDARKAEAALTGRLDGKILSFEDHAYAIAKVRQLLDWEEGKAVRNARRDGRTWAWIGETMGMTRQAAWEKWRHLDEPQD